MSRWPAVSLGELRSGPGETTSRGGPPGGRRAGHPDRSLRTRGVPCRQRRDDSQAGDRALSSRRRRPQSAGGGLREARPVRSVQELHSEGRPHDRRSVRKPRDPRIPRRRGDPVPQLLAPKSRDKRQPQQLSEENQMSNPKSNPQALDPEDLFGSVIHSYSRAEALEDGALIDVTSTTREAGFLIPVALTRAVWES